MYIYLFLIIFFNICQKHNDTVIFTHGMFFTYLILYNLSKTKLNKNISINLLNSGANRIK